MYVGSLCVHGDRERLGGASRQTSSEVVFSGSLESKLDVDRRNRLVTRLRKAVFRGHSSVVDDELGPSVQVVGWQGSGATGADSSDRSSCDGLSISTDTASVFESRRKLYINLAAASIELLMMHFLESSSCSASRLHLGG